MEDSKDADHIDQTNIIQEENIQNEKRTWYWYHYFFIIGTISCCSYLFTFKNGDSLDHYFAVVGLALLFVVAFGASGG